MTVAFIFTARCRPQTFHYTRTLGPDIKLDKRKVFTGSTHDANAAGQKIVTGMLRRSLSAVA